MRAVFDVSILIRLTFGSPVVARLIRAANDGTFTMLVADLLLDELVETAKKPRLVGRVDTVAFDELVAFLKEETERIRLTQPFPLCRDRDDEYLLALARDGRADFLVTNDHDLLSLEKLGACEIVTPEEFSRRLEPPHPI
ncbi:MAG: putative toxin-antitoxin system toxin component, PIN family [Phycisphaerales bacterium]|nr:putative toxin-antitoxin system toxin component, PIN family [Phycisphaerales bacterium]